MLSLKPIFTAVLWGLAVVAIALSSLGVLSALGYVKLTVISDNSAGVVAPNGSIEVGWSTPTEDLVKGDVILLGGTGAGGSILGEILDIEETSKTTSVTLGAPNFETPDPWAYDLGSTTYKHLFAIPFIGKPLAWAASSASAWMLAAVAAIFMGVLLWLARTSLFKDDVENEHKWFARLPSEHPENGIEVLKEIFAEQGVHSLKIVEKRNKVNS